VLDAYAEKRVRPSPGQVFDHIANAAKRNGKIAWCVNGLGGEDELVHTITEAQKHRAISVSSTEYIDVHCWRFTPISFSLLISDLHGLGLIGLEIQAEFNTVGCEFYVSLGWGGGSMKSERLAILQKIKLDNA